MKRNNFFDELKRRNVYKVAVAYGITAWLLAQVASLAANTFEAPIWVMKMTLVTLIIGFPVALLLAWAYEMTPEGIVRTDNLDNDEKETGERSRSKPLISNLAIGVLLVLLIAQFFYTRSFSNSNNQMFGHDLSSELSIAVLPLINLNSKDENLEYFSDGLTQEIIDELAKVDAFSLTAFTTTLLYKNNTKPYDQIGEELNVQLLISGTSRIINNDEEARVILSIELIDAESRRRIWNSRYEEVLQNAPKLQLDIAKDIAENLKINLSPEEKDNLNEVNTNSGKAFQLFLKAKQEMSGLTTNGFDQAEKYLLNAIELDANYTQAYTLLAWNYTVQGWSWYWRDHMTLEEGRIRAKTYIDKALELDVSSSDTYLVRANYHNTLNVNIANAIEDVETALRLNSWPEIPTNYCICTAVTTYVVAGKLGRAKELAGIAAKIDPGNLFIFHDQGLIYMLEGKMLEARAMFQKALDIMDIPLFNFAVGWSLYHNGNYEESIGYFENFRINDTLKVGVHLAYLSNAYFKLGDLEKSKLYLRHLQQRIDNGGSALNMSMALISAEQNNDEVTIDYLKKAYEIKEPMMTYLMGLDPLFKPLKDNPGYIKIWNQIMTKEENPS